MSRERNINSAQINRFLSHRNYKTIYGHLTPPSAESLLGTHKGEIIGRKMQRTLGRPSLAFMQLGGWWGKQFDTPEQGINIVQKRGQFRPKLPMLLEERPSLIRWQAVARRRLPTGITLFVAVDRR